MSRLVQVGFCLAAFLIRTTASEAQVITLELRMPSQAALGEAVPVGLSFANRNDPIYIEFSGADYGTESLIVCAQRAGAWFRTGQIHLDREIGSHRFDFIPLRRDQRFESPIIAINDPAAGALPILRLTAPGTYEVFASYESRGSDQEGVLWPIWRGAVRSATQVLTLTAPSADVLIKERLALRACVSESTGCDASVIGYFQVVRDQEAAQTLVTMLDATSVPAPFLAEAVANQVGLRPHEALQRFATRFPSWAGFVKNLLGDSAESSTCERRQKHIR